MNKVLILCVSVALLSSCQKGVFQQRNPLLSQTAAEQALQPGAYSTALVPSKTVLAGRIYHQDRSGRFYEICQKDFEKQNALKALVPEQTPSEPDDVVEDQVYLSNVSVGVGPSNLRIPYTRTKVTGYTTSTVETDGDPSDFIISNLAENCRNKILPRNKPYFVTSSVAVATKAEVYSRSFVDSISWGSARYDGDRNEKLEATRKKVVFGVLASRVE